MTNKISTNRKHFHLYKTINKRTIRKNQFETIFK